MNDYLFINIIFNLLFSKINKFNYLSLRRGLLIFNIDNHHVINLNN